MSLVELADRIATHRDRRALQELHDHRVLCYRRGEDSLRLVEYLQMLSEGSPAYHWRGNDTAALTLAYDLTVDKFSHLPVEATGHPRRPSEGPDCCHYYRAFLTHVTAKLKADPPTSFLQAEMIATESLRALVTRHFYLSCLESRRRVQRLARRYVWRIDGQALYLWLPVEMPGGRCRQWLEAHVPDVEPGRPGEQERVQAIVNRLLGRARFLSLDQPRQVAPDLAFEADPVGTLIEEEIATRGLARTIADEKADNIGQQRPAICRLGPDKLRELILEVSESLVRGDYQGDRMAGHFGLSNATFSRFAGGRWQRASESMTQVSVPDLWRNTAQTLARHPDFVAAARAAGVWKRVTEILHASATSGRQHG